MGSSPFSGRRSYKADQIIVYFVLLARAVFRFFFRLYGVRWCFVFLFLVVSTSAINCLERLVSEVTCYVSSGTLNPAHSTNSSICYAAVRHLERFLCAQMLLERHTQPKRITSFNLYVNVKNFVCRIGENADILLTLYDSKEGQFFRSGSCTCAD